MMRARREPLHRARNRAARGGREVRRDENVGIGALGCGAHQQHRQASQTQHAVGRRPQHVLHEAAWAVRADDDEVGMGLARLGDERLVVAPPYADGLDMGRSIRARPRRQVLQHLLRIALVHARHLAGKRITRHVHQRELAAGRPRQLDRARERAAAPFGEVDPGQHLQMFVGRRRVHPQSPRNLSL